MRRILMIAMLVFGSSAQALITGPSTSTGQFTLSFNASGYLSYSEYLVDESTADIYLQSPATFTKPNGTYLFTHWVCVADLSVPIVECYPIDTHTVVVDSSAPPPPAPQHVVKYGDFNGDGLVDAAVVATDPLNRLIDDFILRNTGGGTLTLLTNPSGAQLAAARNAPTAAATARIVDLTLDGKRDVLIKGLNTVIAGAPEHQAVWSQATNPANHPTVAVRITAAQTTFLAEVAGAQGNPNFYANAVTQQCITQTGWYILTGFVPQAGWYYNHLLQPVYVPTPGYYTLAFYLTAGTCFNVLNTAVVQSLAAYDYDQRWSTLQTDPATSVFQSQVAQLLAIVRSVLGADIGEPAHQPPLADQAAAERLLTLIWQAVINVCEGLDVAECVGTGGQEAVGALAVNTACQFKLVTGAAPLSSNPFRAAKVPHAANQNFGVTAQQFSFALGATNSARLDFWTSRLNVSKDPAAPLAIDIVNNAYLLGCAANERYILFASAFGAPINLTEVGVDLMRRHRDAVSVDQVGLPGKLRGDQIALYHHAAFGARGLPNRTFGGTPMTGQAAEANRTKIIWCPSCE